MSKKKGKTPSLITGSSGKPVKVTAKRQRPCGRCSSNISSGESCFEIPKVGGGFSSKKTFCPDCFREVLSQTKEDIAKLETSLEEGDKI